MLSLCTSKSRSVDLITFNAGGRVTVNAVLPVG